MNIISLLVDWMNDFIVIMFDYFKFRIISAIEI